MDLVKRGLIYVTIGLLVLLLGVIGYYRSLLTNLEGQVAQSNAAYVELMASWKLALAERANLRVDNAALEASLTAWQERPVPVVYRDVPPDCKVCVSKYRLDKEYVNPAVEKIPAKVIVVSIEDVLGKDRATWTLDASKLCPVAPPPLTIIPPATGEVERLSTRFVFEAGGGYGVAGYEANVGLYPLSLNYNDLQVDLGAWATGTLHSTGDVTGNAVLGLKLRKLGSW